ncbi:MAG: DegV family protein [Syntrophomonadaceae bacterium]|nr:DegV family protein [Syntrophomonadaceae bacterium]
MNEKIALLVDSMCDLPREIIDRFGIYVIAPRIIYPYGEFRDRLEITPEEVYGRMPDEIPTTSLPSIEDIMEAFDRIKLDGFTHVLAVHISNALSSTVEVVAMQAKEIKELTINVVDSKTLTMGTGWMVYDAAKNIAAGWSFDKVVQRINQVKSQVKVYYILETLEYLRRGGRIGKVAGMLAEFMHFKPVISVDLEGKYFTFAKTRGRIKSIEKLVEIVQKAAQAGPVNLAIMHGGAQDEFDKLVKRLTALPNIKEVVTSDISPALGVNTGPGLLGVAIQEL